MKNVVCKEKRLSAKLLLCLTALLFFPPAVSELCAQDPIFSAEVSANGRREHLVKVNRWGRYAVQAKSTEGVSVEIVDKLRGPFAKDGEIGKADGRVEAFLEAGYYKVFTEGPQDARGQVYLTVDRFSAKSSEGEAAKAEYLAPFTETAAGLGAAEAKAWWIFVPKDTLVLIEATGRRLSGLAVFRSGEWLAAEGKSDSPFAFVNTAVPEKPLFGRRIYAQLERGKHLVVAFGGDKDGYAVHDDASPLYVRWMQTVIPHDRQTSAKIGGSGISTYAVSPQTESVIIESFNRERLAFESQTLTTERLSVIWRDTTGYKAFPGSIDPAARVTFRSGSGIRLLAIIGKPGTEFRLTPVASQSAMSVYRPSEDGAYRISTMHTNLAGDNIGASGLVVDMKDTAIIALSADTVSATRSLRRQFNMLGELTLYLWVDKEGTYTFSPDGEGQYSWRIRKFFVSEPRRYNPPRMARGRKDATLDRGLHIIEIDPQNRGKAAFTLKSKSDNTQAKAVTPSAPRQSIAFKPMPLKKDSTYRVYINRQNPDMSLINIVKDPQPKEENLYITDAAAEREEANTSRITELVMGTPHYADIKAGAFKTYHFQIPEPGIYKIETTGRLHTKLVARDRFGGLSFSQSGNGVGRNAVITEYFLPGRYVLLASAVDKSAGRAGVVITKGELLAGGRLENGIDRRAALKAHEAAVYDFDAAQNGNYRLESFTQENPNPPRGEYYYDDDEGEYRYTPGGPSPLQRVRFEDASGWPAVGHGEQTPLEIRLNKGAYKFYSLPAGYDNYRATRVRFIEPTTEFTGKDTATTLFSGTSREIMHGWQMRVRVDSAGVYEIFSQGREEISARLCGQDRETEIARSGSDHRDWNFVISEQLDTGTYYLQFERTRYTHATQVHMRRVRDTLTQTVNVKRADADEKMKLALSGKRAVVPIETSSGDVLIVTASGNARIIATLESPSGKAIGTQRGKKIKISLPTNKSAKYTLKIRPEERKDASVDLAVRTAEATPLAYEKALSGVSGAAAKAQGNSVYYRIDNMPIAPAHYELISTPADNDISGLSGVNETGTAFRDDGNFLLASEGKRLWIEAEFPASDKFRFVMSPVRLTGATEAAERNRRKFETADKYRYSRNRVTYPERGELPVTVRPGLDKIFEIESPAKKLGIVEMTLISGQPLVGLSTTQQRADFVRGTIPVLGGQYVDDRYCLMAVIPGDTGRIVGWNALPGGSPDGVDGALAMKSFAVDKFDSLKTGRTAWQAKAERAKEYRLKQGSGYALTVKLSPRTGAAYASADGNRSLYYGADHGAWHTFEPSGGSLFLFGADSGDVEIEMYASLPSPASNVLTAGREINKQVSVDTRETVRIKNEPPAKGLLFVSGSASGIRMINRAGQMTQNIKDGAAITGQDGVLLVDYAPGHSKIRHCADDGSTLGLNLCRWGEAVKKWSDAPIIKEMSKLPLADGANWYSIELAEPTHVSLSSPVPAAAIIAVDSLVRDYEEFAGGLSWDIPLPPGKFTIGIKRISAPLAGVPLTFAFYPVSALSEEKPLSLYLMPGEKRMVRFDIPKKGKVGVGLSAENGTAEAYLLDKWGRSVSQGRQIFTELEEGTYHVLLSVPETGAGTGVTLRLYGQSNPSREPPEKLMQRIRSN